MSSPRWLGLLLVAGCHTASPAAAPRLERECPPPREMAAKLPATASGAARRNAARSYLERCGRERALDLARTLITFPTITGQRGSTAGKPFLRLAEFLRAWSDAAGLDFRAFGAHEVWELGWGQGSPWLAFVLHADVVPVVTADTSTTPDDSVYPGWQHPPFAARVTDGKLYGRGSEDDKGPLAAVMTVLETLAAFGIETPGPTLAIIGTDEESTWDGMLRYVQTRPHPSFTISVDSDFPVVVGEDGFVVFGLEIDQESSSETTAATLVEITAGEFLTQVPPLARLRLLPAAGETTTDLLARVQREAAAETASWPEGNTTIAATLDDGGVRIEVQGKTAHSSTPEDGFNPLWPAAGLIERLNVAPNGAALMLRLVRHYSSGDHFGERLGLAYTHALMGSLVIAPTILRGDHAGARIRFNMRRPAGLTEAEFNDRLDRAVELIQREISPAIRETEDRYVGNPVYTDPTAPLVELLLDIYRTHTGDRTSRPLSVRGGSYARLFPGGISFGPSLPGRPYLGHTQNEYIEIETLALLTHMLFDVVDRLSVTHSSESSPTNERQSGFTGSTNR